MWSTGSSNQRSTVPRLYEVTEGRVLVGEM